VIGKRLILASLLTVFTAALAEADPCEKLKDKNILAHCQSICVAEDEHHYFATGSVEGVPFEGTFVKIEAGRHPGGTYLKQVFGDLSDGSSQAKFHEVARKEVILGPLLETVSVRAYESGGILSFFKPEYVTYTCQQP
jgi:hypothetical protein